MFLVIPASKIGEFRTLNRSFKESLFAELRDRSWKLADEADRELANGNFSHAQDLYRLAKDTDPVPSRTTEAFASRLREFATGKSDVTLLDFPGLLERMYPQTKIGCNLFGNANYCDQFHPNETGHRILAEQIFNALNLTTP